MKIRLHWKIAAIVATATIVNIISAQIVLRYYLNESFHHKIEDEAIRTADLVRYSLLAVMMDTNDYEKIAAIVDDVGKLKNFKLKLIRSPHIIKQYGLKRGEAPTDDKEREVLATGKTIHYIQPDGRLKVIYPFITDERCGKCHMGMDGKPVPAGIVNGVASLWFDLREENREVIMLTNRVVVPIVLVLIAASVLILVLIQKLVVRPMENIAHAITQLSEDQFEISLPEYSSTELDIMASQVRKASDKLSRKRKMKEEEIEAERNVNAKIRSLIESKSSEMGIKPDADSSQLINRMSIMMDEGLIADLTKKALKHVTSADETLTLPSDPKLIEPVSMYLGGVVGACAEGVKRKSMELVLDEALTNAIIHGNLEVSSRLKETDFDAFNEVVDIRTRELPYSARKVNVRYSFDGEKITFVIKDEGPGFEWRPKINPSDAEPDAAHGRGLMIMRALSSRMEYNDAGNELTLMFEVGSNGAKTQCL